MLILLIPAFGQMTAEEWFDKGIAFMNQSNYEGATQAFDKAIEMGRKELVASRLLLYRLLRLKKQ